jgi:hypothetical protein
MVTLPTVRRSYRLTIGKTIGVDTGFDRISGLGQGQMPAFNGDFSVIAPEVLRAPFRQGSCHFEKIQKSNFCQIFTTRYASSEFAVLLSHPLGFAYLLLT